MDSQSENINNDVPKASTVTEELPEHFYDSDIASVNENDFLSDNEPPKDKVQERKLLCKQKFLHTFKTIIRIGHSIARPARYDLVRLRYRMVPEADIVVRKKGTVTDSLPVYFCSEYLEGVQEITYNLGYQHEDIQRLVVSMKKAETAVFQLEHLYEGEKTGIKLVKRVEVIVISVDDWRTVIDMDCDGKYMKQIHKFGSGLNRVSKHDEISFSFSLHRGERTVVEGVFPETVKMEQQLLQGLPNIVWKVLKTMKEQEQVVMILEDQHLKECEGNKYERIALKEDSADSRWRLRIAVGILYSIDDVYLDGTLLKKYLVRGVSTAQPECSSLVYYALRFLDLKKNILKEDSCFGSDWWQDFGKLEELGCRKNYLDDYTVSKMLKGAIKRMKPGEISEVECRDPNMFQYGVDYDQMKDLLEFVETPKVVFMVVRVYNFTEGKNCFNMQLEDKIAQSKRKKEIAIGLLKRGNIAKAFQRFQNIVSYYGSGEVSQQAYDEKVSALMNSVLCLMKEQKYAEMIPLCNQILQMPRHGYDIKDVRIRGPHNIKIQGEFQEANEDPLDCRKLAAVSQNLSIIDKCLYRKAWALYNMGESGQCLQSLDKIQTSTEQVDKLRADSLASKHKYERKSVKIFQNMFKGE